MADDAPAPKEQTVQSEQPTQDPAAVTVTKVVRPSFDIVRISPEGDTVIAGRAAPGAEVVIFDGDEELGRAKADERGEWVFLPEKPLPTGSRRLRLAILKDGKVDETQQSEADVVLVVPENGHGEVVAVQLPNKGGASRVMQRPGELAPDQLSIAAVDYDADGNLGVSGGAPAKAKIMVYVDNASVGEAEAADNGDWRLQTGTVLPAGSHTLRADHVAADGKVLTRAEVTFTVADGADAPKDLIVVVEPGNSLWRIARRIYGKGLAYTLIFEANRSQIRDPDLIYPGQQFVAPPKSGAKSDENGQKSQ